MATVTIAEVNDKYRLYAAFKAQLAKLSKEDRVPLRPHLLALLKEWHQAVHAYRQQSKGLRSDERLSHTLL